jgi:hypothetical protein
MNTEADEADGPEMTKKLTTANRTGVVLLVFGLVLAQIAGIVGGWLRV